MTALLEFLKTQLSNQFAAGGLMMVAFGALLAALRRVPGQLLSFCERRFVTTVDIADHDPAFFWIQRWLGDHEYTRSRARLLTVSTRTRPNDREGQCAPAKIGDNTRARRLTEVIFSPAPGRHLLRYRSTFLLLTRVRTEGENSLGDLAYHERLEFKAFSREVIREIIYEAREAAFPPEDNRIAIMRAVYNGWRMVQRRLPRSLDSVILDGNTLSDLMADMRWFFGASGWYANQGVPYQRGYLLTGPPGTGKTSAVVALASAFERDTHIISLSTVNDSGLAGLMAELPEHAIVLIEDIDRAFQRREKTSDTSEGLTFSGFINAIDGVSAPPGRVLFMTTNHPEQLDPALTRPGRADRVFQFGNATPGMAQRLFARFFPGKPGLAAEFGERVGWCGSEGAVSMAALQEHLLSNRDDAGKAADFRGGGAVSLVSKSNGSAQEVA